MISVVEEWVEGQSSKRGRQPCPASLLNSCEGQLTRGDRGELR